MSADVYILGGAQTDFAINWSRQSLGTFDMMSAAVAEALDTTDVAPSDIQSAHIGNFTGELFTGQGHLGGFFASLDPAFAGIAATRHEAACASGSMSILAAMAEIQAGRYDLCCVLGVEEMRNVPGQLAADHLAAAAWRGVEATEARYPWPAMFSDLADFYSQRFGLDERHLAAIAELNFANAKANPLAQSRSWIFDADSFSQHDEANPVVEGRLRRHDCGQITDGAAALLLASADYAKRYCARQNKDIAALGRIAGFGHRVSPMLLADKLEQHEAGALLFPHMALAAEEARQRAGIHRAQDVGGFEVHDCFTITELIALEHLGLCPAGRGGELVESGSLDKTGAHPVNASGGLIGAGHPVGATGVRMLLDGFKQVTHTAGDMQIEGIRSLQTLNIGGSATTIASFVVERAL